MGIIKTLLNFIIALSLIIMIYMQIKYIKADWCSWEIQKVLFQLEDIQIKMDKTDD